MDALGTGTGTGGAVVVMGGGQNKAPIDPVLVGTPGTGTGAVVLIGGKGW